MTREDFIAFDIACRTASAVQAALASDEPMPHRYLAAQVHAADGLAALHALRYGRADGLSPDARDLLARAEAAYAEATAPARD